MGSGSGGVAVGPFDAARQCGHFGTKYDVWLWLVAGWQSVKFLNACRAFFLIFFFLNFLVFCRYV
jgi:hypothetical protein